MIYAYRRLLSHIGDLCALYDACGMSRVRETHVREGRRVACARCARRDARGGPRRCRSRVSHRRVIYEMCGVYGTRRPGHRQMPLIYEISHLGD